MPVTPPPKTPKKPTEAEIEAMINRGGAIAAEPKAVAADDPDKAKFFNLRLTVGIFNTIDKMRAKRPRKPGSPKLGISTHDWIVEAVLEKLEREKRKHKDS
ncbi:hypothetical protein ACS5NO_32105 [Larkinella sp. GY13]|uniref:hypothetical protein n=1 Tax=Larkinella sp. GY13 TaxID=3453720 RepID=UPI003EE8E550